MYSPSYYHVDYVSYADGPINDYNSDDNQPVGYNWYQSNHSSDTMEMNFGAPTPCYCSIEYPVLSQQVGNPLSYPAHEYEPPPISPSLNIYATTNFTPQLYDENFTSKVFEESHNLSPCVSYAFEPEPPTYPNITIDYIPQLPVVSSQRVHIFVDKKMSDEVLSSASNDGRNSNGLIGIENSFNKLASNFDDSFVMGNLLIHQNSSSITEYVEDFMRIKSRAEFIFECEFADIVLAYCFVVGLKEEIREALELWSPGTLQEAIYLAKFQESLIKEILLVEAMQIKSVEEQTELELQKRIIKDINVISNLEVEQTVTISINLDKRSSCTRDNDLQKQIKENVSVIPSLKVMQNTDKKVTIANNLDMRYGNACSIRNFDPGGCTILASILSIEEGFLGLELKVHAMSSFISQEKAFCGHHKVMEVDIKEEFSEGTRLDRIYAIEHKALARVIMLETITTHFFDELQQLIVPRVSLKAIKVVKEECLSFRRLGSGGNH
ncbi:uncharacterized protein LOC141697255 [Apium graveolens]|uniref:uncharacterized protein LOC141697255 n=1 Tax=Apium graveolens TaxID=4045 RepID=UPI003D7A1D09